MKDVDYEIEALLMALTPKGHKYPPRENQAFLEAPESKEGHIHRRARMVADENGNPTYEIVPG